MLNLVKQAEERAEKVKANSKHKIYTVLDIAGYVVNTNLEKGIRMRRHRLDMFLYYIQLQSIMQTGKPIFDSSILVRTRRWPYTEWMDNYCGNKYRIKPIPRIETYWDTRKGISELGKRSFNPHITMADRELLDDVIDGLNDVSNRDLKNTMANSGLTQRALEHPDKVITEKMMIEHCERTKRFGEFLLSLFEDCMHML